MRGGKGLSEGFWYDYGTRAIVPGGYQGLRTGLFRARRGANFHRKHFVRERVCVIGGAATGAVLRVSIPKAPK